MQSQVNRSITARPVAKTKPIAAGDARATPELVRLRAASTVAGLVSGGIATPV
jgi:hypothetical protein